MTLHVLQLGPIPPPDGGISRHVAALRAELAGRGHLCSLVATSKSSSIRTIADEYHPATPLDLVGTIRCLNGDVVHLHIGGDVSRRVMALAMAVTTVAKRSVLTMHSGAFPLSAESRSAARSSVRGRIFRRFDQIIAVNDAIAGVFERYGVSAQTISVIPPHALTPPDPEVTLPPEYITFIETHSPVLLSVGGLEADYDPIFQINALRQIIEDHPNAGLMIVGDGSMRTKVENAVAASGLTKRILLAGNVEHALTLHLIQKSDVLLRTTLFDGDAISVREALFLGTSVIATDNGMRPDGVKLIASGSFDDLINAINEILPQPQSVGQAVADTSNIKAVVDIYEGLS